MRSVRNGFVTAIAMTVLDLWVALHCVPPIWKVFGDLPWTRVAILIVASAGSFTLMDIWARTAALLSIGHPQEGLDEVDHPTASTATNLMEAADV